MNHATNLFGKVELRWAVREYVRPWPLGIANLGFPIQAL